MGGGTTQFGVLSPRWGGTGVSLSLQTPIIALVGNDACWSQIAREQVAMLGSNVACGLEFVGEHCPRCPQRVGGGQLPSAGGSRWRCVTVGWDGPCWWHCVALDGAVLVAPCGLGWGRAGGTVWPWMGLCLLAPCGLGWDCAGGTVWPWMGPCWWHCVALDRAMLVALHHRRLCHICCPRVPLYGTAVTLRTRPCLVAPCGLGWGHAGGTASPQTVPHLLSSCPPLWHCCHPEDQAVLVAPCGLGWGRAGGTVWHWMGLCLVALCGLGWGRAWWHCVALDGAVPGGTMWPWMGLCWWHRVALDQAMPGGTVWPWMGPCWWHCIATDCATSAVLMSPSMALLSP